MSNAPIPPTANTPARTVPASTSDSSPARRWAANILTFAMFYVVMTPPLVYAAARTGILRDISTEDPVNGPVNTCIAPARWVYEDSPLKSVLQPWAEFWYDVLLT